MKTNSFFLLTIIISFFICFGKINAQEENQQVENRQVEDIHAPIPKEEIASKIKSISGGVLKDQLFWSVIGFFLNEEMSFASVTKNTIYVSETGVFYRIDIADEDGNPAVASVLFIPHNRNNFLLNEHLCICKVNLGYSQIVKRGTAFVCVGIDEANEIDNNINLECHDTEVLPRFISKYYDMGIAFTPKLTTIPTTVKELTEDAE